MNMFFAKPVLPPKADGGRGRGAASASGGIVASQPAALGLILGIPKNFSLDVAEFYWWYY